MKQFSLLFIFVVTNILSLMAQGGITQADIKALSDDLNKQANKKAFINAISNNDIKKLAFNRVNADKVNSFINTRVETQGITDQKSSGRCWMFTGLNILRAKSITEYGLGEFQFSQNYLFFYDQLEKANLFYEAMIETAHLPLDDRKVEWLLKSPINDGGQWTGLVNLVEKYGLVPSYAMPETYHSNNTSMMGRLIKRKLRENGMALRNAVASKTSAAAIRNLKLEKLSEIYRILAYCLGEPPADFVWQYKGKDGVSKAETYTPMRFAKEVVKVNFSGYVMLMNDPTRAYYKLYEIEMDRHVQDGDNWKYINLPIDKIKDFAMASLKDNNGMYFSCDVGKQLDSDKGRLDINNYDYDALFDMQFGMNKTERVTTYESGSSHGMALMGVNILEDGTADKWLLENSWGMKGDKGHLVMTDEWFNEYMFRLVIHKRYLDADAAKVLEQKPIILPPWDPMFEADK